MALMDSNATRAANLLVHSWSEIYVCAFPRFGGNKTNARNRLEQILAERGELTASEVLTTKIDVKWTNWSAWAYENQMRMENWDDEMATDGAFPKSGFKRTRFDTPQLKRVLPPMEARHGMPATPEDDADDDEARELLAEKALRIVAWTEGKDPRPRRLCEIVTHKPSVEECEMSLEAQQDIALLVTVDGTVLSRVSDASSWTKACQAAKAKAEVAQAKAKAKEKPANGRKAKATPTPVAAASSSGRKRKDNPSVDRAEEEAAAKKARLDSSPDDSSSSSATPVPISVRFRFKGQGDAAAIFHGRLLEGVLHQSEAESKLELYDAVRGKWLRMPAKGGCSFAEDQEARFEKYAERLHWSTL